MSANSSNFGRLKLFLGLGLVASISLNFWFFNSHQNKLPSLATPDSSQGQEKALCETAKEHLRSHWSDNRGAIEKVFRVVNEESEMKKKFNTDLTEIKTALSLNDEQISKFTPIYRDAFLKNVNQFKIYLNQPKSNWSGMFETLKEFYQSEDKIVLEHFGSEKLKAFRSNQIKKRTPMLALVGQYAGIPWDQNIIW